MNVTLLWTDAVLSSLLWVAAVIAASARLRRRWLRIIVLLPAVGMPLINFASIVLIAWHMKFNLKLEPNWFGYSVSLFVTYVVGTTIILRKGLRRGPGLETAALSWRPVPIAVAGLLALVMSYMTLIDMDVALRARCAIRSVQLNSLYLATSPAIVSDAQNAAFIYEKAFADLPADEKTDIRNAPYGENAKFDPNEPATVAYLKRHAATIRLLRRAAAIPGCRFEMDLQNPDINELLSTGSHMRRAANLLWLDAREELANGRTAAAIVDASAIYGISRHCAQRPMLISSLEGISMDAIGFKVLQEAVPLVKDKADLAPLHLEELTAFGRLHLQALRGEEQFGLAAYGYLGPDDVQRVRKVVNAAEVFPPTVGGIRGAFFRVFVLNPDHYMELMDEAQRLCTKPIYESNGQLARYGATHKDALFVSILAPALSHAFGDYAHGDANDVCAKAAVAATRYRLEKGRLPDKLEDLVPDYLDEIPTDPFDGKPLRWIRTGEELTIYSIGPDFTDNGGAALEGNKGDICFRISMPKQ